MASSPVQHFQDGIVLDRYAIRRKLGSGSTGTVYLAHDGVSKRLVALKVLRRDRLSEESIAKLQEEFQAIARLHHPQIATAYDFGYTEERSLPFYTREYIHGTPLPPGPPGSEPPGRFLRPILNLLDALDYLHAHGILHLDIHPGNLIAAEDPSRGAVLIDFGLIPQGGPHLSTSVEILSGLPPELLRDGIGDVLRPAVVGVGGIRTVRGQPAEEEEAQDGDRVGDVHGAVGVRVSPDEEGYVVHDVRPTGDPSGKDAQESGLPPVGQLVLQPIRRENALAVGAVREAKGDRYLSGRALGCIRSDHSVDLQERHALSGWNREVGVVPLFRVQAHHDDALLGMEQSLPRRSFHGIVSAAHRHVPQVRALVDGALEGRPVGGLGKRIQRIEGPADRAVGLGDEPRIVADDQLDSSFQSGWIL